MTVQLKSKLVKTSINEIIAAGIKAIGADSGPVLLITRGMAIDLDDGTVTLKFKPNKEFGEDSSTANTGKEPKVQTTSDEIVFERGTKSELKAAFKENIPEYKEKGVLAKQFGAHVTIKDSPFLIVGFEDGKFLCKNAKGRDVKKPLRATIDAFEESLGDKPVSSTKPKSDKKPKVKPSETFSVDAISLKTGPKEEKIGKKEKAELERKFEIAAGKMKKDGIKKSWFFKVVTVKNKRLRLIKLSSTRKVFVVINVDTGKRSKLKISVLLPL